MQASIKNILTNKNETLLNDDEIADYNIEGYLNINSSKMPLINALKYDQIEVDEIIETNQEYKYYFKYFFRHVYKYFNNLFKYNNFELALCNIQEHFNFIGVLENNDNELVNFVLSLMYEDCKLRCILR